MRPELIEIADDKILNKCVEMTTRKLSRGSGVFMLTFQKEKKMTLKEYKRIALNEISERNRDYDAVETQFWQHTNESSSQKVLKSHTIYAMDNDFSRYPDECTSWNLNKLTNVESIIHNGTKISGLNCPQTNYGMTFCSFASHCEDSNLGSINTLHEGEPRTWYTVPQSNAEKLENLVQSLTPKTIACDLFIRHKSVLIPPEILQLHRIEYAKV